MKKISIVILIILFSLNAQALFEIKDASDNTVLEVSADGLRIFNQGDTLMVISSTEIKAFIANSKDRALSRSFSVTTSTTGKGTGDVINIDSDGMRVYSDNDKLMDITGSNITAYIDSNSTKALSRSFSVTTSTTGKESVDVLEVSTGATKMREGGGGDRYTDFSPDNIFLGLNSGVNTVPEAPHGNNNIFLGNNSGVSNISGTGNVFIGTLAGYSSTTYDNNTFVGAGAGYCNTASTNIYIGNSAGFYSQTGSRNIFIGGLAGESNDTGYSNIFIGNEAGSGDNQWAPVATGYDNVLIGDSCAFKHLYGRKNTMVGTKSGLNNISGIGNVFIGNRVAYNETGSNKLYVDNSSTSTPLIYGEFDNDSLQINGDFNVTGNLTTTENATFNGNVGIGNTPSYALNILDDYVGIYSEAITTTGTSTYGVFSKSSGGSVENYAIYGYAPGTTGTNWAGYFSGDVNVTGTLSKGAGSFKIDHPLDPENKYLYHSFVESPDMKNIYDGVVILDNNGEVVVTLPEWFDALNDNFRYQLTAIGAPGPNLYVADEISNNEFKIAGGSSGMKVSWMVTGIRKDNFANTHRIPIEVDKKNEDRGYYIHPEAFGLSKEKGIDHHNRKKETIK